VLPVRERLSVSPHPWGSTTEEAEERAFEEDLLRLLEAHPKAAAEEPLSPAESFAFAKAVPELMERHRAYLERRGIDVAKAVEEMTAVVSRAHEARQRQASLRRQLNEAQAGPYGDIRYHG